MAEFENLLKKWFYTSGNHKMAATRRLCLLDADGNPIGSDTIENIAKLVTVDPDKYVDLGLPSGTLWAKCNLGATAETGYGWYFSWGNTDAHPQGAGYDFSQETYNATPAASIDGNLTMAQDAASVLLGNKWRMPTRAQFEELTDTNYISYEYVYNYNGVNGLNGCLFTSKVNGNTLFLPAQGYIEDSLSDDEYGYYWLLTDGITIINACSVYFGDDNEPEVYDNDDRFYGYPIRPVINR